MTNTCDSRNISQIILKKSSYEIDITFQWILGHRSTSGNEKTEFQKPSMSPADFKMFNDFLIFCFCFLYRSSEQLLTDVQLQR